MTYLILGLFVLAVIAAMRATFWFLHVTTDRGDEH